MSARASARTKSHLFPYRSVRLEPKGYPCVDLCLVTGTGPFFVRFETANIYSSAHKDQPFVFGSRSLNVAKKRCKLMNEDTRVGAANFQGAMVSFVITQPLNFVQTKEAFFTYDDQKKRR